MTGHRVAVVGGGAVGLTAALELARGGATVTLFDRGGLGGGATARAAGLCYDAFATDVDAGVGARALSRFRSLAADGELTFHECPYVMVAREGDDANARAIETAVERMQVHDRGVSLVSPTSLPESMGDGVAVAARAENAGWVSPADYVGAVAARAATAGVTLRENVRVGVSIDPPGVSVGGDVRPFDAVLVAAGAHTKRIFEAAGAPVPLELYRAQVVTGSQAYDGPMYYDATAEFYCRPHSDGILAGDGVDTDVDDPDAGDGRADSAFVTSMQERLATALDYDLSPTASWGGVCTATPDGDPLLGEWRPGVYVAAGWYGHGFMRAPATGEAIAKQMLGDDGIGPFDPSRFGADPPTEFDVVVGMS